MRFNYLSQCAWIGWVIIPVLLLSACNKAPVQDSAVKLEQLTVDAETFVYECDNYSFTARTEGNKVWLFLPGQTVHLPQVVSASGIKYSTGGMTFWSKGEEALLVIGNEEHKNCQNNRKRAIWENAKLNGVDFRAVGNEPGWVLELTLSGQSVLVTDYGQSRFSFATPDPEINQQARLTRYRAGQDGNQLLIEIEGKTCHDTMSGEVFESRVKVVFKQKKYQGCGNTLH